MTNKTIIAFDENEKTATVVTGNDYLTSRIEELSERFPDEVEILMRSEDRGEYVIPRRWLKVNPPRQLSDEERQRRHRWYYRNLFVKGEQ